VCRLRRFGRGLWDGKYSSVGEFLISDQWAGAHLPEELFLFGLKEHATCQDGEEN
jgi:hypothetical protein